MSAEAPATPALTAAWAQYASGIRYEQLPPEVVEAVKGLVLDTIGTALAGSGIGDGAEAVAAYVLGSGGNPQASLIGCDRKIPVLGAAFGNGAFGHTLNFDANGPRGGHLGVAAVPAPLAFAERSGASGRDLIAAVAVAVDLTSRLAAALSLAGVDANERFIEGQVLGYFGATVGAARVLRFSPEQLHDALGFALMQAAGTRQVSAEGRSGKAIYGGYPNQGAATAVLLAEQGLDARCAALEGPAGVFNLFFGGAYDRGAITEGLGRDFPFFNINFKPWPTSGRLHPFIRAAAALRRQHSVSPEEIKAIRLRVAPLSVPWVEPSSERRHPQNAATAANSIYFGVSRALVSGSVTLADVSASGLRQRAADALADLIDYTVDEELSHSMAVVEIETTSGTILTVRDEGQRRSMSFAELVDKFEDCAQHARVPARADALRSLIETIERLEHVDDAASLIAGLH